MVRRWRWSLPEWRGWVWPVAAVALAVGGQSAAIWQPEDGSLGLHSPDLTGSVLVALIALPLALAAREPLGALGVSGVSLLVFEWLRYPGEVPTLATLALVPWVTLRCSSRASLLATGLLAAGLVAVGIHPHAAGVLEPSRPSATGVASEVLVVLVAALVGIALRAHQGRADLVHREQAVALDLLALRNERAAAGERLRLARLLHDSVGHSITHAGLLAEAAAQLVCRDPGRAEGLLQDLVASAREAMVELHEMVGLLRETGPAAPPDGDVSLDGVVERFASGGLEVALQVEGEARQVPEPVQRVASAIVAEGLANVVLHAQARRACVHLLVAQAELVVEVTDDGRGPPDPSPAAWGFGLTGAAERAAGLGGWLELRPAPGGGGLLRAVLPVPAGASW